jgi:hypothetical protein
MPRITIESEKIVDITNQLQRLIERGQKTKIDNYKNIRHKIEILDKESKEKIILDFIDKNPGTSIQGVVEKANYARMTVYRAIDNLLKYGLIIEELDGKKHLLYVNKKSVMISTMKDIKIFKIRFFELVRMASEYYKKIEGRGKVNDELFSQVISIDLVFILKHLIMRYSLYAVFEWPTTIKDTEGLYRLYIAAFQSLNDIFSELAKKVPFHLKDTDKKLEFLRKDMMFLYGEFEIYEQMITEFHRYGLDMEFDSVMSNLFKAFKMPRDWGDFRAGMEEQ